MISEAASPIVLLVLALAVAVLAVCFVAHAKGVDARLAALESEK